MAASASASTFTAADSNNSYCYDVFINHRGPDVKKTFASHLYRRLLSHGLTAFLDQDELQVGLNFESQIKEAITTASLHVAIFSPTYADSEWCLRELVLMLESGAPIIPVFHQVKPAKVRHARGEGDYARALQNLENKINHDSQPRHNFNTVENWRDALSTVAEISGLELEAFNRDEGVLVDKVVECVLQTLQSSQLYVAKYPTGLEEKVEDLEKTVLSQQRNGRVGITGLGGAGKTTLALELFNRKKSSYSKSHFLSNVREKAKSSLPSLQTELLKGLFQLNEHIYSNHQGTQMLKKHLSSSKVFVVLDDVDHEDQVSALFPHNGVHHDSLILITSRDKDVLARSGVQGPSIYYLRGLDTELSRELFCLHAFCQPHPLSGFESLVYEFVRACDGLPLSLKVFGGLLYGNNDKQYWEDELERLEQILPHEIQKRLQISYDALQRDEQQIFLDIACFFIGENKDTPIRIWDASNWQGSRGLRRLLDKCLVEVVHTTRICKRPGQAWRGFLVEVDSNYLGMHNVNEIRMHDHLRDLGRDLAKDPGQPCRLNWSRQEDIDDLLQQSSGVINVRGIRMLRSEHGDDDDESASVSSSKIMKLQLLDIDIEADRLERILRPVMHLPNLIWLRWRKCSCSSLPRWIPTKNLRLLQIEGEEWETLWQDEWQAPPLQLRELQIDAPLSNIPKSIGKLKHLERIQLTGGKLEELPKEFCYLHSLKQLKFPYFSRLRSLPDSFGNLTNLERIDLTACCKLKSIPGLAQLTQLRELDVSKCRELEELQGLEHMRSLKDLRAYHCVKLKSIPELATELRELDVCGCSELEELPDLKYLEGLEELRASACVKLKSIQGLAHLTQLVVLDVSECCELEELPGLEHMRSLKELRAFDCVKLKSIPGLAHLTQLRGLDVSGCWKLEELPSLEHLRSLEKLWASRCLKLKSIQGLAQLTQLLELHVRESPELEELPGLEHLRSLEKLWAHDCPKLKSIQGVEQLTNLRELIVYGCPELDYSEESEEL